MTILSVIVMVFTLISGGGVALASGQALPGEMLYPVKTALEDTQLALSDDFGDATLLTEFNQERIAEMEALLQEGEYDDIPGAVVAYIQIVEELTTTLYNLSQQDWEGREVELTRELLATSHQTLIGLLELAPDELKPHIEQAITASESALQLVEIVNAGGIPELPAFELPVLPPVDIPPVELPEIPPVELPEVPPVELPQIELPGVEVPQTGLPTVELPLVEISPFELPDTELPTLQLPLSNTLELPVIGVPGLQDIELPLIEVPEINLQLTR